MDDFSMNISSQNQSYDWTNFTDDSNNYTNNTYDHNDNNTHYTYYMALPPAPYRIRYSLTVTTYIVVSLGVPLTLPAICSLYIQVSSDHVAPIYVINLLVSDLLQFGLMIIDVTPPDDIRIYDIFDNIYSYSLLVSVGFMVCVALERYLLIVHPLWYRCRRTIKSSVVVCVLVWLLPLVNIFTYYIGHLFSTTQTITVVFLLLPLPLFIFFLGVTVKALSASVSVPLDEKRRIVGILILVLLIYMLLFLPIAIDNITYIEGLPNMSSMCRKLSPLADLLLYVFMRKGAVDKLLAAVCCC